MKGDLNQASVLLGLVLDVLVVYSKLWFKFLCLGFYAVIWL